MLSSWNCFAVLKKKNAAFTLVELFVTMLIMSAIAAMAIPMLQKYIEDSKKGEASLKLKQMYDTQTVFHNEQPFLFDNDTPCLANPRFSPVSTFHCLTKECDAGEDMTDFSGPPAGRKGYVYAYSLDGSQLFANTNCDMVARYNDYGALGIMTFGGTAVPLNSGQSLTGADTIINMNGDTAGFFNLVVFEDPSLQVEVGANAGESMQIVAYADTDGDYVAETQNSFMPSLLSSGARTHPFNIPTIWSMARGIYIDPATGEVKGTAGIFEINEGE